MNNNNTKWQAVSYITQLSVLVILLLFFSESCNWFASWDDSYDYQIKIDSVTFPQPWVNASDTLKVAFWGKIGDDDCCSFARFEVTSTSDTSTFKVMAHKRVQYRVLCNSGVVMLNGKVYPVYPLEQGTYTVIINQPDGSNLVKQVYIH